MAGRFPEKASARWWFPCGAFSVGVLSLCAGGFVGGALVFGVAAAIAWRTGRSGVLRWALTALAVVCVVGLLVLGLDAWSGVGTLIVSVSFSGYLESDIFNDLHRWYFDSKRG